MNKLLGMNEEQLDQQAEEYETDTWDSSNLGKVIIGRPRIADEEIRAITVRLPISQISVLDSIVHSQGGTRSSAIREAVREWLIQV